MPGSGKEQVRQKGRKRRERDRDIPLEGQLNRPPVICRVCTSGFADSNKPYQPTAFPHSLAIERRSKTDVAPEQESVTLGLRIQDSAFPLTIALITALLITAVMRAFAPKGSFCQSVSQSVTSFPATSG